MKSEGRHGRVVIVPLGSTFESNGAFVVRQIGKKSYLVDESQIQVDISSTNKELFVTVFPTDQTGAFGDSATMETPEYLYRSDTFHTVYAFTPSEKGLIVMPIDSE